MTSQQHDSPSATTTNRDPSTDRLPLRLTLVDPLEAGSLSGAWWPQSDDLDVEVADLVDNFSGPRRISRLLFSRPDWSTHPHSVRVARGRMKVGLFPNDDTHVVIAALADHTSIHLMVVPSHHERGAAIMSGELGGLDHRDAGRLLGYWDAATGHDTHRG